MNTATAPATAAQAPGCFGAASVFALDCDVCNACPAFTECRKVSHQTLEAIKGVINVEDILKRHQKARLAAELPKRPPAPTPKPKADPVPIERKTPIAQEKFATSEHDQAIIDAIPNVKVKAMAVTMSGENKIGFILDTLRERKNPFALMHGSAKYPNMRVACDMLLEGGFTKAELARRYVKELGWTEGTASSQRGAAVAMLVALNVVHEVNGGFILKIQS